LNLLTRPRDQWPLWLPALDQETRKREQDGSSRVVHSGLVREAFMVLLRGPWLDYDPIGLVVLLVGIVAVTTLAVGF
jgi:hypothetical protein